MNTSGWRLNEADVNRFELEFRGQHYPVEVVQLGRGSDIHYSIQSGDQKVVAKGELEGNRLHAEIDGHLLHASIAECDSIYSIYTQEFAIHFSLIEADLGDEDPGEGDAALSAPMNGTVVDLVASEGSIVSKGDTLLVMEAMKMEHTIRAPEDGEVVEFYYRTGDLVDGGAELLKFEPSAPPP